MFKKSLLIAVMTLASSGAFAQGPPMDMSWAMRSQMQNQAMGNQMANQAAMQYYNYMRQLRAQGYTGPSLPTGITPQSLNDSVNGANRAGQSYIRDQQLNSARRSAAIRDNGLRGTRGCTYGRDRYGNAAYLCP